MRLSMWMIANRLHALDPEVNIISDAPMELCSARTVVAPKCLHVYRRNKDVVCKSGSDYIILHDIEFEYVFNIVQGIFDFYNDWSTTIQQAVYEMNFQRVIDECWFLFTNPIILMDGGNRCLAMSSQYEDDEVDYEWAYVAKNHFSSPEFIRKMRQSYDKVDLYQKNTPKMLYKDSIEVYYDTLTTAIYYNDFYCGRINVLGKEREFNYGDIQVIGHLLNVLAPSMYMIQNQEYEDMRRGVFFELLCGKRILFSMAKKQADYLEWGMNDIFQLCVIKVPKGYNETSSKTMICNMIRRSSLNTYITVTGNEIVVIFNLKYIDKKSLLDIIQKAIREEKAFKIGISSPMNGIMELKKYHDQARGAIEYGCLMHPKQQTFFFYDYALYYMFESNDPETTFYAMHPDILYLDKLDREKDTQWLMLLKTYFDNECSLVNTAKALYVHRNTLVYRLGKLRELVHYDWDNLYNKDYMKQSILMLDFFRIKYGQSFGVEEALPVEVK